LPDAIRVADQWHLIETACSAFLEAAAKSMKQILAALGAMVLDPTVAAIEEVARALSEARTLIDRFQSITRRKVSVDLDP
jgi:crotonobetainyl-CoA:carnitine CoA-transferase CaiB-like acyl-CoA transferase